MNIKCIAIGNRIMKDDGIGVLVAEAIKEKLMNKTISVVICDTDIDYALNELNQVDLLFIIDSSYYHIEPGTVTVTSLNEQSISKGQIYSQHQPNLIDLIKTHRKRIEGYIIGIEIGEIAFGLELSECLSLRFNQLCEEVYNLIMIKVKEVHHA